MGKRLPNTPNSRIKSALRQLFLRSRERAKAMKEAGYTCAKCGAKQSRAKGREVYVECHHRSGIDNWAKMYDAVRKYLLNGDDMQVLCKDCNKQEGDN